MTSRAVWASMVDWAPVSMGSSCRDMRRTVFSSAAQRRGSAAIDRRAAYAAGEGSYLSTAEMTAAQSQAAENAVPIRVSSVEMNSERPTVSFILENTSSQVITAWNVRITTGNRVGGRGVDGYRGLAGLSRPGSHIVPGGTLSVTASLPPGQSSSSSPLVVTAVGAIFEDRSFAGDPEWADSVFKSRAAQLAAWTQVVSEFQKLQAMKALSVAVLEVAVSRFDAAPYNDGGDIVRANARTNLKLVIEDARKGSAEAGVRLDAMLVRARSSMAAASAHVRQWQPGSR